MRIDLHHTPQTLAETTRSSAQTGGSGGASARPALGAGPEDQAELSGAHTQVQALVAEVSQLPEVREERVHALRQAVESGQYSSSPEKVAGAMFAHMIAGRAA